MARQVFRFSPSEWHSRPEVQRLSFEARGFLLACMWIAEVAKRPGYIESPSGKPMSPQNLYDTIHFDGNTSDANFLMELLIKANALDAVDGCYFIPWMVDCAEGER